MVPPEERVVEGLSRDLGSNSKSRKNKGEALHILIFLIIQSYYPLYRFIYNINMKAFKLLTLFLSASLVYT